MDCHCDADDLWPFPHRTLGPQPRHPVLRWRGTSEWSSRPSHLWPLPRSLHPNPRRGESRPPPPLLPAQWQSPKALHLLNRSQPPTLPPPPQASPPSMFRWGQPSLDPSTKSQGGTLMASSPSAAPPKCSTCPPSPEVLTLLMDHRNLAFLQCLMEDIKSIISQVFFKEEEAWAPGDQNHSKPINTNLQVPRRPTSQMCHQAWPPTILGRPFHQR